MGDDAVCHVADDLDVWSRRVVGWAISERITSDIVVDALEMARLRRRPGGTVVHSDRGTQYTSWVFGHRLHEAGLLGSMGRIGCGLDNAVAESFFGSMIGLNMSSTVVTPKRRLSASMSTPFVCPWASMSPGNRPPRALVDLGTTGRGQSSTDRRDEPTLAACPSARSRSAPTKQRAHNLVQRVVTSIWSATVPRRYRAR